MDLESAAKIVFYIISAVIAHGLLYGTAQANWPSIAEETRTSDRIKSSIVCLAGPAAIASVLIVSLLMGRKIAFRLRANRIPEREILLCGGIRIMRRYPRTQRQQEQRLFTQADEAWPGQAIERERIRKHEVCTDKSHWHNK